MITIIAEFSVKKGYEEKFRTLAAEVAKNTKKEYGNIAYNLYQQREDSSKFTFIEEWLNDDVIAKHNNAPHFEKFIGAITPMLTSEARITQYEHMQSIYF